MIKQHVVFKYALFWTLSFIMTVIVVKIAEKDEGILLPNTAITVSCGKLYEVFEK